MHLFAVCPIGPVLPTLPVHIHLIHPHELRLPFSLLMGSIYMYPFITPLIVRPTRRSPHLAHPALLTLLFAFTPCELRSLFRLLVDSVRVHPFTIRRSPHSSLWAPFAVLPTLVYCLPVFTLFFLLTCHLLRFTCFFFRRFLIEEYNNKVNIVVVVYSS